MNNFEWEQNGSNWMLKSDKGFGYIFKVAKKNSYKIEVEKDGLFKTIGKKQSLEWAKRVVEQYFGLNANVEPLRYSSQKAEPNNMQPVSSKLRTRSQEYRSRIDMCELWYNKE